ncbi:MAG TPA: DinB family protein [Cyclobacteriaceae bacterium]
MALQKDQLLKALTTSFDEFITVFSSFEEEVINHKPSPNSWTPAQVVVHIIKATDGVPDHTTKPLDREVDSNLPKIRPWWEDLNQKFTSPEPLQPDDKPHSKKELIFELQRVREKDLSILLHEDLTLLCLDFELPGIGCLTRYEWLWFIQMHLNRHTFQLQNMK